MKYFEKPTQVMFLDAEEGGYNAGIAYGDEIICSCCGSIFEINDLLDDADPTDPHPIIVPMKWVDFSDGIKSEVTSING